jgi:hypothetical protein
MIQSKNCYRDIDCVLRNHPELGRDGWRIERDDRIFEENRTALREAHEALALCRRVFNDRRFRKLYRGKQSDYGLKHVVEFWDFNFDLHAERDSPRYNGLYVGSGVAVAAAFLEGFVVRRLRGLRSGIEVPKPSRLPIGCCQSPDGPQQMRNIREWSGGYPEADLPAELAPPSGRGSSMATPGGDAT